MSNQVSSKKKYRTFNNGTEHFDNYNRWNLLRQSAQVADLGQAVNGDKVTFTGTGVTVNTDHALAKYATTQPHPQSLQSLQDAALNEAKNRRSLLQNSPKNSFTGTSILDALSSRKKSLQNDLSQKTNTVQSLQATQHHALNAQNFALTSSESFKDIAQNTKSDVLAQNLPSNKYSATLNQNVKKSAQDTYAQTSKIKSLNTTQYEQLSSCNLSLQQTHNDYSISDLLKQTSTEHENSSSNYVQNDKALDKASNKSLTPNFKAQQTNTSQRRFGSLFSSRNAPHSVTHDDENLQAIFQRLESCQ